MNNTNYIFIIGGVVSGLGKGVLSASIAKCLQFHHYSVDILKFDPYLNIDCSTMNPAEHGEIFVTNDGAETDLDLGHYFRFTGIPLSKFNNVTTGQLFHNVISQERVGKYKGSTIQIIPHITDQIIESILHFNSSDFTIVEVGGTVGDIESQPFIEAIRQFTNTYKRNSTVCLVSYVPELTMSSEQKSKPTQHAYQTLLSYGVSPKFIFCRSKSELKPSIVDKLSLFCNTPRQHIFSIPDVNNIYQIPLNLLKLDFDKYIIKHFDDLSIPDWDEVVRYERIVSNIKKEGTLTNNFIHIGIIGKYNNCTDSYISLIESITFAAAKLNLVPVIHYIDSDDPIKCNTAVLSKLQAIIIPGGFGDRGIKGKIFAAQYARENNIPFLGICLGMQCAVIEYARNVLHKTDAHSAEFSSSSEYPLFNLIRSDLGLTCHPLRKGAIGVSILENTKLHQIYQTNYIKEIHRHKYKFNNDFVPLFTNSSLILSSICESYSIIESVELKDHKFFIGVQYHPEFKSSIDNPHPLFVELLAATSV